MLDERKVRAQRSNLAPEISAQRGDLAPELGAQRGLSRLQIRLRRNIFMDHIDDFSSDVLCRIAADTSPFRARARVSRSATLSLRQITASDCMLKKCRRSGFNANRKRS